MRRLKTIFISVPIAVGLACAQPSERKNTPEDYIAKFRDEAVAQMHLFGVPASITMAQGMLESGNGNSALSVYANNHFGIKCHLDWSGEGYIMDDDEKDECFRKYPSVLESFNDHSLFLKTRDRYALLFELSKYDYAGWARGLKDAGYATHPDYAQMLISLVEKYRLFELDKPVDMNMITSVQNTIKIPKMVLRPVVTFNHSKFVITKKGDSFFKIANEYGLEVEQLLKFNDLDVKAKIMPGQKIYIVKKRKQALEPVHVVTKGETIYSIAQLHGIRIYWLYKRNNLKPGQDLKVGDILVLRRGGKKKIILRELEDEGVTSK